MAEEDYKMCYNPIRASKDALNNKLKFHHEGDLLVPCGKCEECKRSYAIEWATRVEHEISLHPENSFITLTYNDDYIPSKDEKINHQFQKFMKRLRKKTKKKLTYLVSHEFGSQNGRLHHHAIIFNYNPQNQKLHSVTKKGSRLYTSQEISDLWTLGYHSIGEANAKTAYYIASYSVKKQTKEITDSNGEITDLIDTMDASSRPAIGYRYLIKNFKQLCYSNEKIPRYYKKKLSEIIEIIQIEQKNRQRELQGLPPFKVKQITPEQRELMLIASQYLELHENKQQVQPRSIMQKYAKMVIQRTKHKIENQFREQPTNKTQDHLENQFKEQLSSINKGY